MIFSNDLRINTDKTKAILFHLRHKNFTLLPIHIDNTEIEIVAHFQTLGVYFSEHMSWDKHISYLNGKLSVVTGCMRKQYFCFPISVNIILYNGLFSSLLNYGVLVWGTTTLQNIGKLLLMQKRVIRIVNKAPPLSHTSSLFHDLKIINVKSI